MEEDQETLAQFMRVAIIMLKNHSMMSPDLLSRNAA